MRYNGKKKEVMMEKKGDMEDLEIGLRMKENIVKSIEEIEEMDIVDFERGIDIKMKIEKKNEKRI